jgi:hypothetical protein
MEENMPEIGVTVQETSEPGEYIEDLSMYSDAQRIQLEQLLSSLESCFEGSDILE